MQVKALKGSKILKIAGQHTRRRDRKQERNLPRQIVAAPQNAENQADEY